MKSKSTIELAETCGLGGMKSKSTIELAERGGNDSLLPCIFLHSALT